MEILIIVLVVVIAVYFLSKKNAKTKKALSESSKLTFSDEYRSDTGHLSVTADTEVPEKQEAEEIDNHVVDRLYFYHEDPSTWICPNCEVENASKDLSCCVCGYRK